MVKHASISSLESFPRLGVFITLTELGLREVPSSPDPHPFLPSRSPSSIMTIIIQVLESHANACQKAPFLPTSCGQSFVTSFSSALARGHLGVTATGAQIAFLVLARYRRPLLALRARSNSILDAPALCRMAWHGMAWHGMGLLPRKKTLLGETALKQRIEVPLFYCCVHRPVSSVGRAQGS